jgi:hypothetical protein
MSSNVNSDSMSGYMQDSQGRLVPIGLISDLDKLRDQTVREITERAIKMQEQLSAFKERIKDELLAYLTLSFERYGKKWGGPKGNVTLTSYDGTYRLILSIDKVIFFDEQLQIAKLLIDECVIRWSRGSRDEIRILVSDAFQVDKGGSVNVARILGLRRLEIQDAKWQQAMEAIGNSIQISGKKEYLRFYKRDENGKYQRIPLDVAAL